MASGYAPHRVDWTVLLVVLKNKDTGALRILRVVLDHHRTGNPPVDLLNQDPVIRQFVIPVRRDPDLPGGNQLSHAVKRGSHSADYTRQGLVV